MNQPNIDNSNALILLEAADKLNIKTKILREKPFSIEFTHQNKTHLISKKSMGINTSRQAREIARNKALTNQTLALSNLPTPRYATISQLQNYQDINIPFPQVIKPLTGEKGKHIYLNIQTPQQGQKALEKIFQKYPNGALVETYHQGNDYRFLCLNFKLIGLSQRLAPTITGNGQATIRKLIEVENDRRFEQNQKLGRRMLNRLRHWPRLEFNLEQQNLSLNTILPQGKIITLYKIPNFSTGGSVKAIDPNNIHPDLINLAETAAKTIGLEICGIDMIIKPHSYLLETNASKTAHSLTDLSGECRIIEVNSDPGLRLHDWPNQGQPQHVAEKILKSIFNL